MKKQLEGRSILQEKKYLEPYFQTVLIDIKGMTCNKCVDRIARILWHEKGVKMATVSLRRHRAEVCFDRGQTTLERILRSVTFTKIIPKTIGERKKILVHRYEAEIIAQENESHTPASKSNSALKCGGWRGF